jgi:hypothetical protein
MSPQRRGALFVQCIYIERIVMFGGLQWFKEFMPRITEAVVPRPPTHPNPFGTYLALTVERSGLLFSTRREFF